MSTTKPKAKRTTFLDLAPELRQEVFLLSLNDDELQYLLAMGVYRSNKDYRVLRNLDCRIDFNKQVAALRAVDLALLCDVEFAKKKWVETHEELMAKWEKAEPECWTQYQ